MGAFTVVGVCVLGVAWRGFDRVLRVKVAWDGFMRAMTKLCPERYSV